jgi:hypothetical protein
MLLLAGCKTEEQVQLPAETIPLSTNPVATEPAEGETVLYAVSVPAVTEAYQAQDGTELFSYTGQHMQLILPNEDVADNIVLDFLNRVDASSLNAERVLEAAQYDYVPGEEWFPYFYQIIYSPTRIDEGILSLFGAQSSYSGGLHGSLSCIAANYDLTNGDPLTLGSIMHMNATKEDFIVRIIDKLNSVADDYYLYDDFEDGVYARLSGDENLYEDFYFTQTGLCFFFSPYEIAPYASGVISIEIPYSELPGLIYDGYFPGERDQTSGTMYAGDFMQTDMEQFDNMAEVTLITGQEIMVVYPEGTVEDIRINVAGDDMNRPEYTIFAALEMSGKNAVVVSLNQEDIAKMTVSYTAGGKAESFSLA